MAFAGRASVPSVLPFQVARPECTARGRAQSGFAPWQFYVFVLIFSLYMVYYSSFVFYNRA